jgi:DNA-binding CsgD family transcriptional regulator/PAS domain-containing protein
MLAGHFNDQRVERGDNMSSIELTENLLLRLYGGPLEEMPWRGFLQALIEHVGCNNAAITLQLSRRGLAPMIIWGKPPPVEAAQARDIDDRHAALGHLDPLRNALKRSGDIVLLEEVASSADLAENEFYRTIFRPYGIERAVGMFVSEPGGMECNIGLTGPAGGVRFGAEHKRFLAKLRPHFEQSLSLFSRMYRDESEIEVLTGTLDRLTIGTFIIDGKGKMIRANGAAQRMIQSGDTFRLHDNRLTLRGRSDSGRFSDVIKEALAARMVDADPEYVRAFRCGDAGAAQLGILVRAIKRDRARPADTSPAVVVYASNADGGNALERLIATLFDLSPSEANLAALLTQGMTLAEAARESGLTESTVRSYSKRIFAKVGVNRQAELIRLILRSVAMLG